MNKQKLMALRKKGWVAGSAVDFLGLSPEETAYVEKMTSLPVGTSREICKICYKVNAVGFSVPDDIWRAVVPQHLVNRVVCLACFTMLADERLIAWDEHIDFFPVSMISHIT